MCSNMNLQIRQLPERFVAFFAGITSFAILLLLNVLKFSSLFELSTLTKPYLRSKAIMIVVVVRGRSRRGSELVRSCMAATVTASVEGVASNWTALVAECRCG